MTSNVTTEDRDSIVYAEVLLGLLEDLAAKNPEAGDANADTLAEGRRLLRQARAELDG